MNNITKIAKMMVEMVGQEIEEEVTLTAIEQTTRRLMQEVGRQTVEKAVATMNPTYPDETVDCHCGEQAGYVRQREGCLRTLFGKVKIKRAYYVCDHCHEGNYPLDKQLGLRPNTYSAEVNRLLGMTGVQLPFGSGRDLFEALTQLSVSDQSMRKASQQAGELVEQEEAKWQEKANDETFLAQQRRETKRPLRLYGAMDATKVHIRDDEQHRWRDLKVGAWFEATGQPPTSPDGEWAIKAKNIRYYTDICPASQFGQLFWSSGVAQQAQLAHELVILGDGAEWIWNLVAAYFPKAIQILDWFHASEHLMPVAQAAFRTDAEQVAWVSQMKHLMWKGKVDQLIDACNELMIHCSADIIRITANYFDQHKERMRYDYFRKQGFQIGSGTIESAAKQIGLMRMKVPGAIWNVDSARKVAKARAAYLSDRWQSLPLAL